MKNLFQSGLVLFLACLLMLMSPASLASQGAKPKYDVTGKWQGKFPVPEDSTISDAENPVAVEVMVKNDAGKLSGSAVFYVIRNKDNRPQVMGKSESALIDPQFDGRTLKFNLKTKGQQPGTETKLEMEMKLTNATEAELEDLQDNSASKFKMTKVQ
jgi:hypothetical protein